MPRQTAARTATTAGPAIVGAPSRGGAARLRLAVAVAVAGCRDARICAHLVSRSDTVGVTPRHDVSQGIDHHDGRPKPPSSDLQTTLDLWWGPTVGIT